MSTTQMDALGAFTYLSDNLPTWISRLTDLAAHTTAKNAEFAETFKQHSAPSKPRRRRNSSVCSIQTDSLSASRSHSQLGVKRRRQTNDGSVDSCNGPTVISTRHNLIIHYDGYTQKTLEEMVRNIGTARNNLRKGKMAQLPLAVGGLRSSRGAGRTLPPALESDASEGDLLASIRTARTRGAPAPQQAARESPFDLADKNLELAHSFCETAAYHFLRAGGCTSELESVKDRFTVLLKIATEEVQRLREEQEAKKEQLDEKKGEADASTKATVTETETPVSSKRPASNEGPIEVDDDQGSVESLDLTAFRVGRLRR
ncbi:hypothetical protein BDW67DRAFT_49074 [Aspergillus spinulosporus]